MKDSKITITGRVIRGDGYGQKLGFPTANLDRRGYSRRKHKIPLGIYAGTASILPLSPISSSSHNCPTFNAAIVIGKMDRKGLPKIEAHLMDFRGVLYGKRLVLTLSCLLRQFVSFNNERKLKAQIRKDLRMVHKLFC